MEPDSRARVQVRPVLTLPQARLLFPGLSVGVNPVLPLERARAALREAEARASSGSLGLIENGGADLIEAILALREAIAAATAEASGRASQVGSPVSPAPRDDGGAWT